MKILYKLIFLISFTLGSLFLNAQNDVKNSKDYDLLPRLDGYDIYQYKSVEFDSHDILIDGSKQAKEGKKYSIYYRHSKYKEDGASFPTRLQILRNYSNAIVKAGGRVIFERYNSEHGYYSFINAEQKIIWIQIKPGSQGKYYTFHIIEEEPMEQEITIDADLIKNKIDIEGKIAIYGIFFDVGKSEIKPESEAAFVQISEYLKKNTDINCWIVGHTDADGSFEVNSKLSLDRATAVKLKLQEDYNIPSKRLFAEGVASLAPVASNDSEAGKKLNRRVELVKK